VGMDRTIRFSSEAVPGWPAIKAQLARVGETGELRMIDGMPAFPDEEPPADWRELRVGTRAGMVSVRRGPDTLTCVVWGNADDALSAAWARAVWACAAAAGGVIETASGNVSAEQFARESDIAPE